MSEDDSAYLAVKVGQDIGLAESDEGLADDGRHLVDGAGVCPVRVVDGSKGQPLSPEDGQLTLK